MIGGIDGNQPLNKKNTKIQILPTLIIPAISITSIYFG